MSCGVTVQSDHQPSLGPPCRAVQICRLHRSHSTISFKKLSKASVSYLGNHLRLVHPTPHIVMTNLPIYLSQSDVSQQPSVPRALNALSHLSARHLLLSISYFLFPIFQSGPSPLSRHPGSFFVPRLTCDLPTIPLFCIGGLTPG